MIDPTLSAQIFWASLAVLIYAFLAYPILMHWLGLVSRRPPIDPKTAVPALRQNVLEVKEMLGRAGIRPPSGGSSKVAPATIRMTAAPPLRAAIKFNAKR